MDTKQVSAREFLSASIPDYAALLAAAKAAVAALSQNHTYPADVAYAKKVLEDAIA